MHVAEVWRHAEECWRVPGQSACHLLIQRRINLACRVPKRSGSSKYMPRGYKSNAEMHTFGQLENGREHSDIRKGILFLPMMSEFHSHNEWKGFRVGGSFSGLGLGWNTIKSKGTLRVKILKKTEQQGNRSIDLCKIWRQL